MSRNRIINYKISGQKITIPKATTIEDIRLIINETKGVVICSSMQKDNVTLTTITDPIAGTTETSIGVDTSICELSFTDKLTIECDYGDDNAKETTLLAESAAIKEAIANAKPEVDLSGVAKQGENPDATLSAVYKLLIGNNEPSPDIPEGVAERLALILEFFGIKPIQAYEFMTAEEVCSELEEIMTTIDIDLTQEQVKEITNNTLNKE